MQVKVYTNGLEYDLTNYLTLPLVTNDDITKIHDTASFALPVVPSFVAPVTGSGDLDMRIPLKPLTRVEITDGETTYKHFVREDSVETIFNVGLGVTYEHKVSTIEQTKLLELKTMPNMTVTQPKSQTNNVYSAQVGNESIFPDNSTTTLTWQETTPSADTAILDGQTLKLNNTEYRIKVLAEFVLTQTEPTTTYQLKLYVDGLLKKTQDITYTFGEDTPGLKDGQLLLDYTTISTNQVVRVDVVIPNTSDGVTGTISMTINSFVTDGTFKLITVGDVLRKSLINYEPYDMNNTNYNAEFTIDPDTEVEVNNVVATEGTYSGYTLHKLWEEQGDRLKAITRMEDDVIKYDFVNQINRTSFTPTYLEKETQQLTLDGYAQSLEVNAENVIESVERQNVVIEPYDGGWFTFRADTNGPEQITDTNLAIKTRFKTYESKKVLAKGFVVNYTDASSDPVTRVWDISDYVVEAKRYAVLINLPYDSSSERLVVQLGKGNTIYFTSGDNRFRGFGYRAPRPTSLGALPDQAIYQIIASVATQETGKTVSSVLPNGGSQNLANLLQTQYRIEHTVKETIRTKIYKHNARDFEREITLYSNQQSKLNDSENLGISTQSLVNKSGNKLRRIYGVAKTRAGIPKIGNLYNSKEVVVNVNNEIENGIYNWSADLYENYANISSFVGVDSAYREFEVPDDDIVQRELVYTEALTLSTTLGTPTHTILNTTGFTTLLRPITNLSPFVITYHTMQIRNDEKTPSDPDWDTNFDVEVEGPVDIKSLGTTTTIRMATKDNWSVDDTKEDGYETTTLKYFQNDKVYKDDRGQYDSARYELYLKGEADNSVSDGEQYPEIVDAPDSIFKVMSVDIKTIADAREKIDFSIDIPFFASFEFAEDIRIYNGFAKYNGFAFQSTNAELIPIFWTGALPDSEQTTLNPTRYLECNSYTVSQTNVTTPDSIYAKLDYTLNASTVAGTGSKFYDGWGMINKTTQELLFLVDRQTQITEIAQDFEFTVYLYPDNTKGKR